MDLEKIIERSETYNKTIISIGYVGLFTILNFTKDSIEPNIKAKIALCAIISLGIFVFYSIIKMIIDSISVLYLYTKTGKIVKGLSIFWILTLIGTSLPILFLGYWLLPALFKYLT